MDLLDKAWEDSIKDRIRPREKALNGTTTLLWATAIPEGVQRYFVKIRVTNDSASSPRQVTLNRRTEAAADVAIWDSRWVPAAGEAEDKSEDYRYPVLMLSGGENLSAVFDAGAGTDGQLEVLYYDDELV